jgi:pimeloyl-ACP methyl ester carboxylesterase
MNLRTYRWAWRSGYGSDVPVVLVNGNPETAAVWGPLIAALGRDDVVPLAPPGFGSPLPAGFGGTFDEYVAWLAEGLESLGEPVDLLGHDWGANFTFRVACERPDLLRSWAIDTAGVFAPGYSFPDICHVWQTPGAGEEAIAAWLALDVPTRTSVNESLGMTGDVARVLAEALDETMGRCILTLYRSVPEHVLADLGGRAEDASVRPGLVVVPELDAHTDNESQHRWLADRAGAHLTVLPGMGHWWMLQDPDLAADTLQEFWNRRGRT